MKGIILAGGSGTRLYPLTMVTSKQLLPVYDKPMIYYPLSVLMLAGIKDIMVISTPEDTPRIKELLDEGSKAGMNFQYAVQEKPEGIAQAFLLAKDFIGDDSVAMILGDNMFYGGWFSKNLQEAVKNAKNGDATVFAYHVNDPQRFGIVEFDKDMNALSIEEKPENPKSNYCVTGLYFYDNTVVEKAERLKPSPRGELEITDINKMYLDEGKLKVQVLGRGFSWIDMGTIDSLIDAATYVKAIQKHQGLMFASPEELAYRNKWITLDKLEELAKKYGKSSYGEYLMSIVRDDRIYYDEGDRIQ